MKRSEARKNLLTSAALAALLGLAGCGEAQRSATAPAAPAAAGVQQEVGSAPEQADPVAAGGIDIAAEAPAGEATRSGDVPSQQGRTRAGEVALAQPGVGAVDNPLEVQAPASASGDGPQPFAAGEAGSERPQGLDGTRTLGAGPAESTLDSGPAEAAQPAPRADRH